MEKEGNLQFPSALSRLFDTRPILPLLPLCCHRKRNMINDLKVPSFFTFCRTWKGERLKLFRKVFSALMIQSPIKALSFSLLSLSLSCFLFLSPKSECLLLDSGPLRLSRLDIEKGKIKRTTGHHHQLETSKATKPFPSFSPLTRPDQTVNISILWWRNKKKGSPRHNFCCNKKKLTFQACISGPNSLLGWGYSSISMHSCANARDLLLDPKRCYCCCTS